MEQIWRLVPEIQSGIGSARGSRNTVSRTGGGYASKYGNKIAAWDIAPPQEYFDELFRVSENQIIWGGNYFGLPPARCFIVWDKKNITADFSMAMCEYAWTSFNGKNAKLVRCVPQGAKDDIRFHPTQKPVEVYKFCLQYFASPGDKILDTHMGSGSLRIACYEMGFDYVGTEIDKFYFEKEEERFQLYTQQGNLFENEELADLQIQLPL